MKIKYKRVKQISHKLLSVANISAANNVSNINVWVDVKEVYYLNDYVVNT